MKLYIKKLARVTGGLVAIVLPDIRKRSIEGPYNSSV